MLPTPELEIARNLPPDGCAPAEAERYTRWLATHHYENFNVVSWLLPKRLHQHFYNVYAYCRWSDDLGDEVSDAARALCSCSMPGKRNCGWLIVTTGMPSHPVLIALRETIRAKQIPIEPFSDLLRAFRQDQHVHRYETWDGSSRLLRLFGESCRAVGSLSLRLPRCGAAAAFRLHLHGTAAREFLAGCFARPGEGTNLYPAGIHSRTRIGRERHRFASI